MINDELRNKLREFRKNYDGRYLKVEYDDDQAVYDMYVEDQLALGRTIEDIEAEDPKCYTVWVMGADKQTLEKLLLKETDEDKIIALRRELLKFKK